MLRWNGCVLVCVVGVVKSLINHLYYTFRVCFLQTLVYINNLFTQPAVYFYTLLKTIFTDLKTQLSPQTTPLTTTTNLLNLFIN